MRRRVLEAECASLMREFFRRRREENRGRGGRRGGNEAELRVALTVHYEVIVSTTR